MKNQLKWTILALISSCAAMRCTGEEGKTTSGVSIQAPEEVVNIIFEAARTGKPFSISELCDTVIDLDPDVRRICELDTAHFTGSEFSRFFASAKIDSVQLRGTDTAAVHFRYGPESERVGSFILVRRGELWKLRNMDSGADAERE